MWSNTGQPLERRWGSLPFLLAAIAVLFVWWKAWVCDDAFITFRHIANCLAGHGPVFNPGERVQGFSHPLWFLSLLLGGYIWDVYATAVVLGLTCTAGIVVILARWLQSQPFSAVPLIAAVAFLLSSRSLVEFQTSGLENALTNLLLVCLWCSLPRRADTPARMPAGRVALFIALLLLNRPDHVVVCLPAFLLLAGWVLRRCRELFVVVLGFTPTVLWYLWATVYYGSPVPNTVYAKSDVPLGKAIHWGAVYWWDYAVSEPVHAILVALILLTGLVVAIRDLRAHRLGDWTTLCVALSVVFQFAYVLCIGGDFMRGRFVVSVLVGAAVLGSHLWGRMFPAADLSGAASRVLGLLLPAVCVAKAGWVNPITAFTAGVLMAQGAAFTHREAAIAACAVLLAGMLWIMRYLRRIAPATHGAQVFALVVLLGLAYLLVLQGARIPGWGTILFLALVVMVLALLWGMFAAGQSIRSPIALTAAAISLAAVSSLCETHLREPIVRENPVITDQQVWFVGRWCDSRFREPPYFACTPAFAWRALGKDAAAYAERYGPISVAFDAMGLFPYHAGPGVQVIDKLGLTDAYVARLRGSAGIMVGHTRREIPRGYLESRGVMNLLPYWQKRLESLDPTLRAEAETMKRTARWDDPADLQRWQDLQIVISGSDLLSPERLRRLPAFMLPRR